MAKRFVNINCFGTRNRINVTDMEDLSELQDAVKLTFSSALTGIDSPHIQLWTGKIFVTTWSQYRTLPCELFTEGGPSIDIRIAAHPANEEINAHRVAKRCRLDTCTFSDLTTRFVAFKENAKMVDGCIVSDGIPLPYFQTEISKLFIRKCYEDVFALLMKEISNGVKSFSISGTPGIGKSLFFIYILYRLVARGACQSSSSLLPSTNFKPSRILYRAAFSYKCLELEDNNFVTVSKREAEDIVCDPGTFYIIDGSESKFLASSCVVLFISSPESENYKSFVKRKMASQWFFPVWTFKELESCHRICYPGLSVKEFEKRYKIYGGVARYVFHRDFSKTPDDMVAALADVDAIKSVRIIGSPTRTFQADAALLHIIVSDDGLYQFKYIDVASKYVREKLWEKHSSQMISNLQDMFGGSPSEISRHLFEIYGHRVFSNGGRKLKCKNLEDNSISDVTLNNLEGKRHVLDKDSLPAKPILLYYESSDDNNFPAIDAISPQGMFQFTVGSKHPIRGVQVFKKVCGLFDKPLLYFVVPSHRFEKFSKQKLLLKRRRSRVKKKLKLEQYVLELPIV